MANHYFQFKQFTIHQDRCAMKVTTDGCLFGAWVAELVRSEKPEVGSQKLEVKDQNSSENLLDIGTGTGLLSLMLAQTTDNLLIDAVEIDKDAVEQAKENIASSPWHNRINTIHINAKEFSGRHQYDLILSNPPFYENELKSGNSKKNKAHHDDGLLFNDLLTIIKRNLKPGGTFYLLLPYKRKDEIETFFTKNELAISHKTFVKQSTQHNYFRILLSGKHKTDKDVNFTTDEIAIRNENQQYTPAFIQLLKDYYLHL